VKQVSINLTKLEEDMETKLKKKSGEGRDGSRESQRSGDGIGLNPNLTSALMAGPLEAKLYSLEAQIKNVKFTVEN